jgi:hypothetical protein
MAATPRRGQAVIELAIILFLLSLFLIFAFGIEARIDGNADSARFAPWVNRSARRLQWQP